MKCTALLLMLAGCLGACSDKEAAPEANADATPDANAASLPVANQPLIAQTVSVACGSCIYDMEGVSGCKLATKIDGKAVLVTGVPTPGHDAGICEHEMQAVISGQMMGEEFLATSFALKP